MRNSTNNKSMYRKIDSNTMIFVVVGIFTTLIWFYLLFNNIEGIQRNVFFSDRDDFFMDYYNTIYFSVGKSPYTWGNIAAHGIPPLSYLLLCPFTRFHMYTLEDISTTYSARYSQLPAIFGAFFLIFSMQQLSPNKHSLIT